MRILMEWILMDILYITTVKPAQTKSGNSRIQAPTKEYRSSGFLTQRFC